jgi:hypothetical protein
MKFTFTTITALVAPILAQSTTPAPTTTDPGDGFGPPWATSDPAKWSSIYQSLVSDGRIPSTLTAAPWPTGSYGPGQGPWGPWGPGGPHGPDGPGGPGGPGRYWGGKHSQFYPHIPANKTLTQHPRSRRSRPLGHIKLRTIQRLVHTIRLALRPLDRMVGKQRMSAF